jgi:hypothetical protein
VSGFFIVAALVAAACYFGWSALAALRSGDVTLYVRGGRHRYFSRRANPAAYWLARRRGGLHRGARHSHFMAVKFWGDVSDSDARAHVSRAMI